MNTNQLKKFAKEARIKLISQIGVKLDFVLTQDTAELRGKSNELEQLRSKLTELGREQLIETVAYTWFNRIMALRFMDANGYNTPTVVTPLPGMSNPEILQNALAGNIEEDLKLDRQRLNDLIDGRTSSSDAQTEAFKMLLVASCNKWHSAMPFMFERISDYTELLLPDDLLSDFSIVSDIRNGMSDDDCTQEELIGWLYQFYISDKKDDVFEGLKKNIKISAENIPAATQLFTPRWIVRYMVENTLGKMWLSFKPQSKLRQHMPYFIESPTGNSSVPLPEGINSITDITFLDACLGSGHVLVYAFDLLSKIYEEEGYNTNEIPTLILEHNLFGIDIDERAVQLAAFALSMKARSYYSRYLRKPFHPRVIALKNVNEDIIKQAVKLPLTIDGKLIYDHKDLTLANLTHAENYGSLIQIDPAELKALQIQKGSIWETQEEQLKKQAELLGRQYHCVVTNPPYMGQKGMNINLKEFVEKQYSKSKTDLMACFIERCLAFNSVNGRTGIINQHSWMFLSSYEILRPYLIKNFQFESMLHLGSRAFPEIGGEVVQNTSFVLGKYAPNCSCVFIRLTSFANAQEKDEKTKEALINNKCGWLFHSSQENFAKIPGSPFGYWLSEIAIKSFESKNISNTGKSSPGIRTGQDSIFIRYWFELSINKINTKSKDTSGLNSNTFMWYPITRGGEYRKWYGNLLYVIEGGNNFERVKEVCNDYRLRESAYYFKEGITWTMITNKPSFRIVPEGVLFGNGGPVLFIENRKYIIAFLNSLVCHNILQLLNPTMNITKSDIDKLPLINSDEIDEGYSKANIEISKKDWDCHEHSWDFQLNNLLEQNDSLLEFCFEKYKKNWASNFYELHKNEEHLNRQFIQVYGLQQELSPEIPLEDITILQEESKIVNGELFIDPVPAILQLLSYSVGCILGRYSIDKPGLIIANQGENLQNFLSQIPSPSFMPDEDNIIPVLDGEWFNDDIVGRFKVFLNSAFSEKNTEENLRYVEETIGKDIRKYFVKDFYNDHIKRYKKRPIYWMFSSPKGHFKALVYMHRYQQDLCSKILNDYLQPFISKLEAAKQTNTLLSLREDVTAREKTVALKEVDRLELMIRDCKDYERTLFTIATQKITIDLNDGVKVNYLKFKEVLVPIKGLEKEED
jgi:type II restriction/modification system DNA methylase subunit YeeA